MKREILIQYDGTGERFREKNHAGAYEFGHVWIPITEGTIEEATFQGLDMSNPAVKELLAAINLKILRRLQNLGIKI